MSEIPGQLTIPLTDEDIDRLMDDADWGDEDEDDEEDEPDGFVCRALTDCE